MRRAARLVILGGTDRILLVKYARTNGDLFWATPGGGLEPGETFAQAAAREAFEELGICNGRFRPLWTDVVHFPPGSLQEERFFLVDAVIDLTSAARARHDEGILEVSWWSISEIEGATVPVYPEELVGRLRRSRVWACSNHQRPSERMGEI